MWVVVLVLVHIQSVGAAAAKCGNNTIHDTIQYNYSIQDDAALAEYQMEILISIYKEECE